MTAGNNQENDKIDLNLIADVPSAADGGVQTRGGKGGYSGGPYYVPTRIPNNTPAQQPNTTPIRAPNTTPPITNTVVPPRTIRIPAPQGESGGSNSQSSIPARSGIGTIPSTVGGIRLQSTPARTNTPAVRPGYDPQVDVDRGDGRYTGPVLSTAPEPWTTPAVNPGSGQRPKPDHRRQPHPSNPAPNDLPPLIYPPGQSPIEIENRSRARQEAKEREANRNRPVQDQDGRTWSPTNSQSPTPTPQSPSLPSVTVTNGSYNNHWMDVAIPTVPSRTEDNSWIGTTISIPTGQPKPQTTPTRILPPAPRFNTTENNQLDLTRRIPQVLPGSQPTRASQQQPASNNPAGDSRRDGEAERAESSNAAAGASQSGCEQEATSSSTSTDPAIKKQEAKKRRVEREVAKLSDADRAINNLPDGLEEKLNEVGYIINRGDNPSIAYRGTREGKLPSGSQLHLADGPNGARTIEQGPSPNKTRISDSARAERNLITETGIEEVPAGYQIHHNTPDAVWQDLELTQQYDKNSGRTRIDDPSNLSVMPESNAAIAGQESNAKKDVARLRQKGFLHETPNHRGSHGEWNKHAKEVYEEETEKLKSRFPGKSLDQIPPEEIEKTVKKVQAQLNQDLQTVDRLIREKKFNELPDWAKPDSDPKNRNQYRLSQQPNGQETDPVSSASVARYDPQTIETINRLAQALADKIILANTFSFTPGQIYLGSTPQVAAQNLASVVTQQIQGKDSIQGNFFHARRSGQKIEITNASDGKNLATIHPNNKIAMTRAFSPQQLKALDDFQANASAAAKATTIQKNGPSLG